MPIGVLSSYLALSSLFFLQKYEKIKKRQQNVSIKLEKSRTFI